jgi:hypothetical protein
MRNTSRQYQLRRSHALVHALAAVSLVVGTGCVGPFAPCREVGYPGILITVVDAETGRWPSTEVTITWSNGQKTISFAIPADSLNVLPVDVAGEETGTFSVSIAAKGYETWTKSGIVVKREGHCHDIKTHDFVARLTRATSTSSSAEIPARSDRENDRIRTRREPSIPHPWLRA